MTFGNGNQELDFSQNLAEITMTEVTQRIFRLIAKSVTGRRVLEAFLPLFTSQRVTIQSYPSTVLEQLRSVLGEGTPIGACFTIDQGIGRIFIDTTSPIGVLAPFLVHEMVHALDKRLWDADGQSMRRTERDKLFLQVEVDAFQAQHLFMDDLKNRFRHYDAFLKSMYPKAKILHEKLTAESIADLYGFQAGVQVGSQKKAA